MIAIGLGRGLVEGFNEVLWFLIDLRSTRCLLISIRRTNVCRYLGRWACLLTVSIIQAEVVL